MFSTLFYLTFVNVYSRSSPNGRDLIVFINPFPGLILLNLNKWNHFKLFFICFLKNKTFAWLCVFWLMVTWILLLFLTTHYFDLFVLLLVIGLQSLIRLKMYFLGSSNNIFCVLKIFNLQLNYTFKNFCRV